MITKFKYKVTCRLNGAVEETGDIFGPDALGMAMRQAVFWASNPKSMNVRILQASVIPPNADKYFLFEIIK